MMTNYGNQVILICVERPFLVQVQVLIEEIFSGLCNYFSNMKDSQTSSLKVSTADIGDIRLSLGGDSEAYRRLIEKYQQHVSKIMWKFTRDAGSHEELVQDVFVEAYLSLRTYKAKAPLGHWLARIATRVGYRYWKESESKKKTEHFSFEEWDRIAEQNIEESDPSAAAELLHKLLAELGSRDRLVLSLRYIERCSIEETAQRTGWTKSMVKVQSWRARNKLKKMFAEKGRKIEL